MTDNKSNTKKPTPSKVYNLASAMLAFQKLAVTAKKDGKNPHFRSNYSKLESVIEAVNQGNQFGLFFTQEIEVKNYQKDIVVVTTVRHIDDDNTYVSKLPILLDDASMKNPQKIGSAITYAKRYTLQAVYGLPSEDDDGNEASKPNVNISKPIPTDCNPIPNLTKPSVARKNCIPRPMTLPKLPKPSVSTSVGRQEVALCLGSTYHERCQPLTDSGL